MEMPNQPQTNFLAHIFRGWQRYKNSLVKFYCAPNFLQILYEEIFCASHVCIRVWIFESEDPETAKMKPFPTWIPGRNIKTTPNPIPGFVIRHTLNPNLKWVKISTPTPASDQNITLVLTFDSRCHQNVRLSLWTKTSTTFSTLIFERAQGSSAL